MVTLNKVDIESEEYKQMLNDYSTYTSTFASGFISNMFSNGIVTEVEAEQLKNYFLTPMNFKKKLKTLLNISTFRLQRFTNCLN